MQAEDYDRAERLQGEVQALSAEVAQSSGTLEALQIESAAHEAKKQELFVRKQEAVDGVIALLQGLHDKQGAKLARHVDIASARQEAQEAELAARRERVAAASADVRPTLSPHTPSIQGSSRRIRDACIFTYVPSKSQILQRRRPWW